MQKKKGKTNVRFNPIMIRFGIVLRQKLKNGLYDTLQKVFNLPDTRILQ